MLTTVEVGEKSDIVIGIGTSDNIVKYSPKHTRNSDGWVYESIRIGLPEVMKTNTITLYDTDNSCLKCAEKNTKNNSLVIHDRVDENSVEKNADSISKHLICCNYCHKKREPGSNFQSLCCSSHSNSSHQCIDQEFIQNTSTNKTDPSLYSRMLRYSKIPSALVIMLLTISCLCVIIVQTKPSSAQERRVNIDNDTEDIIHENSRTSSGSSSAALVSSDMPSSSDALSISFPQSPDPESLPPDTFRKLAQALYQRGDKAANRLSRKFFYNHDITCNDGTSSGYYIRRNYNSKKWIVFLEGGWICHDEISCSEREARERHFMSSDRWPTMKTIGGILSADPDENPHFSDANHVFVPYCSSDSWSGTRKGSKGFRGQRSFMGSYIVREVIRELSDYDQLLSGEELYLAGSSAGGTGVLVNIDAVASMLGKSKILVRGIIDSGWFLDNDPFFNNDAAKTGVGPSSVKHALRNGVKLWNARVPSACAKEYPDMWQCFLGYKVFPFIKTPLFIFQWQFDKFQMYADNVPVPTSKDQWDYVQLMSNNLRDTFNALSTVFSPACIAHEVFLGQDWTNVQVDGVTLPDALECWASSLPNIVPNHFSDSEEMVFSSASPSRGLLIRSQMKAGSSINSKSSSILADDPRTVYDTKVNRNLVRNIITRKELEEEKSRNSITNRANIPVRHRTLSKVLNNRTDRRRLSKYGSRGDKRRKMKRLQRRLEKCRKGDDDACEKLRKHHGKDMFEDDPLNGSPGKGRLRKNSNLVRSLDRRSSRKGTNNDKTSSDRRKRKNARQRNLERRRAKQLRKQKRKQQRRERKRRQREKLKRRRESRKNRKRNNQNTNQDEHLDKNPSHGVTVSSATQEKHHLKVRSVEEPSLLLSSSIKSIPKKSKSQSQCKAKLIDDCSWPHCNRSCPKLKNPKTGQEIDFLTLLQSFGVDMGNVARALGVDINTLINMDKDILLRLLTSQSHSNSENRN